jgi:hypothetical protein
MAQGNQQISWDRPKFTIDCVLVNVSTQIEADGCVLERLEGGHKCGHKAHHHPSCLVRGSWGKKAGSISLAQLAQPTGRSSQLSQSSQLNARQGVVSCVWPSLGCWVDLGLVAFRLHRFEKGGLHILDGSDRSPLHRPIHDLCHISACRRLQKIHIPFQLLIR